MSENVDKLRQIEQMKSQLEKQRLQVNGEVTLRFSANELEDLDFMLERTSQGYKMISNAYNRDHAISVDENLGNLFGVDEVRGGVVFLRRFETNAGTWERGDEVDEIFVTWLTSYLSHKFAGLRLSEDQAIKLIALRANTQHFNYMKQRIDAAVEKLDGEPRMRTFFREKMGVLSDDEWPEMVSELFFKGAYARMALGAQFDYMLILASQKQGIGKGQFAQAMSLEPTGKYFSNQFVIGSKNKDDKIRAARMAVLEIPEMSTFSSAKVEEIKAEITTHKVDLRLPFGRTAKEFVRHNLFIGTTNNMIGLLKDDTGERRFLPLRIQFVHPDAIDTEYLALVLAEAKLAYEANPQIWFDEKQEALQIEHTNGYKATSDGIDALVELIETELSHKHYQQIYKEQKVIALQTADVMQIWERDYDDNTETHHQYAGVRFGNDAKKPRLSDVKRSLQLAGFKLPENVSQKIHLERLNGAPRKVYLKNIE